jgi:hypothetical protein
MEKMSKIWIRQNIDQNAKSIEQGVSFMFDNDVVISIQFGMNNYCEHYVHHYETNHDIYQYYINNLKDNKDCEIIIVKGGENITKEIIKKASNDIEVYEVASCVPIEIIPEILIECKNYINGSE